jgi:hypothetical protein
MLSGRGPCRVGKTVATLMKGFIGPVSRKRFQGVRYSRGCFIRNTYPELKSTVIKSFQDWFPENIAPIKWDAPISATIKFPLADGTRLDLRFTSCRLTDRTTLES